MSDSTLDTVKHIRYVQYLMNLAIEELLTRARKHDETKLESPEKEIFDEFTPKLSDSTFGSDEYKQFLKEMKVALDHHYAMNRHHPECHRKGIEGMDLIDLLEMAVDWKAATMRHANGNIDKSLEINIKRFGLSPQLVQILKNTFFFFSTYGKKYRKPF